MTPSTAETGAAGERISWQLAQRLGWTPWRSNVAIGPGQADLVCFRGEGDKREGLIIEVKTRRDAWPEAERVSPAQLRRLRKMAKILVEQESLHSIQMAVVLVELGDRSHATRWLDVPAY